VGILYANGGKIYCNDYMEIYVPKSYFETGIATNRGASVETLGLLYTRAYPDGKEGDLKLLNIPIVTNFMMYESKESTIRVHNKSIDVLALQYIKDSYILHQTLPKGREVAGAFVDSMLSGKLPKTLNYSKLIDIWWRNLQFSGISYDVPSKIYEMVIASIYRNPHNMKERYGQVFGKRSDPEGYDYATGDVRSVVKNLSTFSGMVFEDIGTMISSGINNSVNNVEEQVSPLEKIIHY